MYLAFLILTSRHLQWSEMEGKSTGCFQLGSDWEKVHLFAKTCVKKVFSCLGTDKFCKLHCFILHSKHLTKLERTEKDDTNQGKCLRQTEGIQSKSMKYQGFWSGVFVRASAACVSWFVSESFFWLHFEVKRAGVQFLGTPVDTFLLACIVSRIETFISRNLTDRLRLKGSNQVTGQTKLLRHAAEQVYDTIRSGMFSCILIYNEV